jgi:hypothetical protein
MQSSEEIAIHEAGHALMFDALEVGIDLVTIEPSEELNFDGHVRLACDSNNVVSVVAGTMAGPAASFYVAHDLALESQRKFASDQRQMQAIHKSENMDTSFDRFWQKMQFFMQGWLRDFLLRHETPIRSFASALVANKTLSGQALQEALNAAWSGAKPDPGKVREELLAALEAQGLIKKSFVEADPAL